MSRILGLDLGENSVGWALVKDGVIEDMGTRIFSNSTRSKKRNLRRIIQRKLIQKNLLQNADIFPIKLVTLLKKYFKTISLSILTIILFLLVFVFPVNWQFWLNLAIGSLIATLTLGNK